MAGILCGVGVGPGDPELMTLKAVRLIRENRVIAVPGQEAQESAAYQIAVQAVPELAEKELIAVEMPMTHDRTEMERYHQESAQRLKNVLDTGENVVFLTLGDPTVYSTFTYLQRILNAQGYQTALSAGVTSFCAAAARVNRSLALGKEELHIMPTPSALKQGLPETGNCVLMKSGRRLGEVRELLRSQGREAVMVENCGKEEERVWNSTEELPDRAGYYSLLIAFEKGK